MKKDYYPLDLSARAYPLMQTGKTQSNFRYSATLDEAVDPALLLGSLKDVIARYPNFNTKIACGFFWHKLAKNNAPLIVKEDDRPPLSPLRKKDTNGYPFRLAYRGNEIVLEVFHAVTDGNIGAFFLTDLLTRYAALRYGAQSELPSRDLATKDAFLEFGEKKPLTLSAIRSYNGEDAFALAQKNNFETTPRLLSEEVDIEHIKEKAKACDVTVTEYIAAAFITAILVPQVTPLKKPLSLFVPVNLRRFFPTNTIQNFVCFERINIAKGESDFSFPSVLQKVKTQFREKLTPEGMQRRIDDIVTCCNHGFANGFPLFLKLPCFKFIKRILNKVRQTAILSNVGVCRLPEETAAHVKDVKFFLNNSRNTPINVAVISYGKKCNVDITCGLANTDIPKRFFDLLNA